MAQWLTRVSAKPLLPWHMGEKESMQGMSLGLFDERSYWNLSYFEGHLHAAVSSAPVHSFREGTILHEEEVFTQVIRVSIH